jgi:hypothetical protein
MRNQYKVPMLISLEGNHRNYEVVGANPLDYLWRPSKIKKAAAASAALLPVLAIIPPLTPFAGTILAAAAASGVVAVGADAVHKTYAVKDDKGQTQLVTVRDGYDTNINQKQESIAAPLIVSAVGIVSALLLLK